jgi:Protein of unknown function (DUF1592)/Protein of unknown function (DUF1588)/Protein of unknown function (DUF1587)/Protein of unknown function (DUF1595)/Protein of unknown function (DUF1585)/Planctomycete cytochrome C
MAFVALSATPVAQAADVDATWNALGTSFKQTVVPFLKEHCLQCHNPKKVKGGIDLEVFGDLQAVMGDFATWQSVLAQVRSGDMPPEDSPAMPTAEARQQIGQWIEAAEAEALRRNANDPGVVLLRRLSHQEYDNTIRDLTHVDIRPAKTFPVDPTNTAGFDNSGESLSMSPELVGKYLGAAKYVSEHLIFSPDGLGFAPHPVIAETDRDKYFVGRITELYRRQPTNLNEYFRAAWRWQHRVALGLPTATVNVIATTEQVSPRYLQTVLNLLAAKAAGTHGPIAALQARWRGLPGPDAPVAAQKLALEIFSDFVVQMRALVVPKVPNLKVKGMNPGAQALVLWKNREMAANRRSYREGAFSEEMTKLGVGTLAEEALRAPTDPGLRAAVEADWKRFTRDIPDAFYVAERARSFLEGKEADYDTVNNNVGRLLSAGFHNQMGYFRDDAPLHDLILSPADQTELDNLWRDFEFFSAVPLREYSGLIWFERSESAFLRGPEFDFARSEDPDIASQPKFKKFVAAYLANVKRSTEDKRVLEATQKHFEITNNRIRWVESTRKKAEKQHIATLVQLATRAFRRPLTGEEKKFVPALYQRRRREGAEHESAIRDTLVGVLMSPAFLYRAPAPSRTVGIQDLSGIDLANRLSYFLWASSPDDELLRLGERGTLSRKGELEQQAQRMLRDPRARGFFTSFFGQWLDFARFEQHNAVDRARFPNFTDELRTAMYEEPLQFVADMVHNDGSILDLLFADHTFVNGVLAKHYGMPEPARPQDWVRVPNAVEFGRGGLLPMAVFQTKNAPGLRTSPVKRGYWVVRQLLGERIPPPPNDVPELPSDEAAMGDLTLRQALAKHSESRACAGCHSRFDAFGLVFEGYGPVGEFRKLDLGGRPVQIDARFPDGSERVGLSGLRAYIRQARQDDFVDNLCRKALAFALNRSLILSDQGTISLMKQKLRDGNHRFSEIINTVIRSPQFRQRRETPALARRMP